jgi:osmotically inducible lipoprotein OsmB
MRTPIRSIFAASTLAAAFLATACANMSERDKDTAIGAGVGGVAGSLLTNGSAAGTVGGAAVGGVVGNQVGKKR